MSLPSSRSRRYALIIVACALPRLCYAYLRPPDVEWGAHYWPMSTSLLAHGVLGYEGMPSTYYEPLYPLFLALARSLSGDHLMGVLALQALVCAVGGLFFFELALLLSNSVATAGIAVAIYSLYPYLVRQSATLGEVSLLTTLLIAFVYFHARSDDRGLSLVSGILLGMTLLTRITVAPLAAFAVCALTISGRWRKAFVLGGAALLVYLPYAVHNLRIDGSIFPTRGGFNLFKANCKYSEAVIPSFMVDVLNAYAGDLAGRGIPRFERATEKEIDRFYADEAFEFMKKDPARTVGRWLRNTVYLFYPRLVPFHPVGPLTTTRLHGEDGITVENAVDRGWLAEISYSASYTPVLLAAFVGAYVRRRDIGRDLILYLVVLTFALVYSISWPATRLRAPMDFVLIFFAACALRRLLPDRLPDERAF